MTASFEDIFTRLIAEAETAAASQAATAPPAVAVEAESATGNIRMRMEAGRLTGLEINAKAMRQTNVGLADELGHTFNALLEDYQARVVATITEQQADLGGLPASLREIQADSVRAMDRYTQGLLDIVRTVKP